MNRRNFVGSLGVIGVGANFPGAILALTTEEPIKVEVLKHDPDTRYETLRTFPSVDEAEDFVRHLTPRLASITIAVDPNEPSGWKTIKSGYRGAVRGIYQTNHIVNTMFEIIDMRNEEVIIDVQGFDGCFIYDCGRAWAIIENIRVEGKPVQMSGVGGGKSPYKTLSPYLTQPFLRGKNNIHYVDLQGNDLTLEQIHKLS